MPSLRTAIAPTIIHELRAARRRGLSLPQWRSATESRLDLVPDLTSLDAGLVVDVGANVGDWTAAVRYVAPGASVLAIEPSSGPREKLERRFAGDSHVRIVGCAISDSVGAQDFYVTGHDHNSSLRPPHRRVGAWYGVSGAWDVVDRVSVPTSTIDALVDGQMVSVLKIDVQGAEQQVLAGASETLKQTAAVLLEVTYLSHYEGDATFPVLHELMLTTGFVLARLSPPWLSAQGTALWSDACYVPASSVEVSG